MRSFFGWLLSGFGIELTLNNPRHLAESFLNVFLEDRKFLASISLRLLDKHNISASQHMSLYQEYARYMALKATSEADFEVPSKIVDEVWHEHLQFNLSYERICRKIFGRIIYHNPAVPGEDESKYHDVYLMTLSRYKDIFGTPPKEIWGELPITFPEVAISTLKPISANRSPGRKPAKTAKSNSSKSSSPSSHDEGAGIASLGAIGGAFTPPCDTSTPSSYSPPASSCGGYSSCGGSSGASSCGGGSSGCGGGGAGCGGGGA